MVQQGLEVALFGAALRVGLCLDGFARDGRSPLRREAERPAIFVGVAFVLIAVAVFACFVPASRAIRVDPAVALRHE